MIGWLDTVISYLYRAKTLYLLLLMDCSFRTFSFAFILFRSRFAIRSLSAFLRELIGESPAVAFFLFPVVLSMGLRIFNEALPLWVSLDEPLSSLREGLPRLIVQLEEICSTGSLF